MTEIAARQVAVVTGAASGIGLALAEAWLDQGMRVVLADVEVGALEQAEAELRDRGGDVLGVVTDVRDPASVDALARAAVDAFGPVDVLCNNAGVVVGGQAWEVDSDRFRWVVEVNLLGVMHGIRSFVPAMVERGRGHVVNTASAAGLVSGPAMASYFASKHGVVGLSEALANDLVLAGHTGVGVTVICPEFVRTRLHEADRNRPDELAPEEGAIWFEPMLQAGIEPSVVAAAAVAAVREGRFYVLPHDTTLDMARKRWAKIEANQQPFLWED